MANDTLPPWGENDDLGPDVLLIDDEAAGGNPDWPKRTDDRIVTLPDDPARTPDVT